MAITSHIFATIGVFENNGATANLPKMSDGDDATGGSISEPNANNLSTSVRFMAAVSPPAGPYDSASIRIRWEWDQTTSTDSVSSVYWRESSSDPWALLVQKAVPTTPEVLTLALPTSITATAVQVLVENFKGTRGGGGPGDPPIFEGS